MDARRAAADRTVVRAALRLGGASPSEASSSSTPEEAEEEGALAVFDVAAAERLAPERFLETAAAAGDFVAEVEAPAAAAKVDGELFAEACLRRPTALPSPAPEDFFAFPAADFAGGLTAAEDASDPARGLLLLPLLLLAGFFLGRFAGTAAAAAAAPAS